MGDLLVIFLAWVWPALLAASLAVGVIWWAIFADKARGRRRCPRCWHDLSRTPGLTCGECGRAARDEAELARTRRRWGIACTATALAVTASVVTQLSILNATWAAWVPGSVLVRLPALAPLGELPAAVRRELGQRLAAGRLGPDAMLHLARTLAAHGPPGAAEDPSAQLLRVLAEVVPPGMEPDPGLPAAESRARAAALAQWHAQLDAMLVALPPWCEAKAPHQWPHAEPAVAYVRATVWGPRAEWRVRRRGSDGPWLVGAGVAGLRREPLAAAVDAGTIRDDGRLVAEFDFEVRRGVRGSPGWGPWTAARPLGIDAAVAPLDPALVADAAGPEYDEAVASALALPITLWNDRDRPVAFRLDLPRVSTVRTRLSVGMLVELCEGGAVRRRLRVTGANWQGLHGWVLELEDAAALAGLRALAERAAEGPGAGAAQLPGWTVRLRSDRRATLEALGRSPWAAGTTPEPCWRGTAQMPAFGSVSAESPPPRSYRLEFSDETSRNGEMR